MSKLPLISAKQLCRALERLGFVLKRQKGSHMFFGHPDGRCTVVPNHPGEHIDRGLLQKILKHDVRISREELEAVL